MKNYIAPEMKVANFNLSDVLTTSGGTGSDPVVKQLSDVGAFNGTLPSDSGVMYVD